jgi:RHS repeat-associated protein
MDITTEEVENNFRFPGQYYEEETGIHYNYFRYYDPSVGRYITPDPIGLEGGINPLSYASNNPVIWMDPLGEQTISIPGTPGLPFWDTAQMQQQRREDLDRFWRWKESRKWYPRPTPDYEGDKQKLKRYNQPPELSYSRCERLGPPPKSECDALKEVIRSPSFKRLPKHKQILTWAMYLIACGPISFQDPKP